MDPIEATGGPLSPAPERLNDVVRLIVDAVHPPRIDQFGSAARGQMGPNSDLDVLVLAPGGADTRRAEDAMYRALWTRGFAADVIALTQDDLQRYGSNPYLIYYEALTEGRDLHRAAG